MVQTKTVAKVFGVAALVVIITVAGLVLRACYEHARGIEVRLHNADDHTLRSVSVVVTGHTYAVGDLPAGAATSVWVRPTSESGVDIVLTDEAGHVKHLGEDGYFEPGYSGWIALDVTCLGTSHFEDHVRMY